MPLLTSRQYRDRISDALRRAEVSVHAASAYVTVPGIDWILGVVSTRVKEFKMITRWDSRDLVSGASDLEVYGKLAERGSPLFVSQNLHAKFLLIDGAQLFVSSANLTTAGLGLGIKGNWEAGTLIEPDQTDREVIRDLFAGAVRVTDSLYSEIEAFILPLRDRAAPPSTIFPPHISGQLAGSIEGLWVRELPWTEHPRDLASPGPNSHHDFSMLGLIPKSGFDKSKLHDSFQEARCCRWLTARLREREQLYFGEASEMLHSALLEDPKPYRKDVKALVSNLFTWSSVVLPETFVLDSPQHSQRLRLVRN